MRQQWNILFLALSVPCAVLGQERNELRRFQRRVKQENKFSMSYYSTVMPKQTGLAKKKTLKSRASSFPSSLITSLPSPYSLSKSPSKRPSVRPFPVGPKNIPPKTSQLKRKSKVKSSKSKLRAKIALKKHRKTPSYTPSYKPTTPYTPAPFSSAQTSVAPSDRPVSTQTTTRPSVLTTPTPTITTEKPHVFTMAPSIKSSFVTTTPTSAVQTQQPSLQQASNSSCVSLESNTTQALESLIRQANGAQTNLCSLDITFEKQLSLDVPVNLTCQQTCVLDGQNTTRLFSFGEARNASTFSVFFQGFTFVRGRAANTTTLVADPNGGAIALVGLGKSLAQFYNCTFLDNVAEGCGGAISFTGYGSLSVVQSLFEGNGANHGGALYGGVDSILTTKDSTFQNNIAYGGGRAGAAIAVDGVVNCFGNNTFDGNVGYPNVLGPSVGCEASGR